MLTYLSNLWAKSCVAAFPPSIPFCFPSQAFLWHLERKDLHEMAAEYARRIGNTLYFYAPKDEPGNVTDTSEFDSSF